MNNFQHSKTKDQHKPNTANGGSVQAGISSETNSDGQGR